MSEKKPPHQSWRSWIDEQVDRAHEEGAFENLPGAGKPLPNLDEPYSENWWLKNLIEREQLSIAPEPIELRRKIELLREELPRQSDERAVRGHLSAINVMIGRLNAIPAPGGLAPLAPMDVDAEVRRWKK